MKKLHLFSFEKVTKFDNFFHFEVQYTVNCCSEFTDFCRLKLLLKNVIFDPKRTIYQHCKFRRASYKPISDLKSALKNEGESVKTQIEGTFN